MNEKTQIKLEINELHKQLKATDYLVLKYIEGKLPIVEFTKASADRQAMRDRINELEAKLCE